MIAQPNTAAQVVLACRFRYDGVMRHVDNVTIDGEQQQLIGMEIRKSGSWSFRIKRYSLSKISHMEWIDPSPLRVSGGKLERP